MLRLLPYAVTLLIVGVALGRGGYAPWAILLFELGAVGLLVWVIVEMVWRTSPDQRASNLALARAWRRLPFRARHRELASAFRVLTLGRFPARAGPEVEILPPGADEDERASSGSIAFFCGYPFRRTHLGVPLLLLTVWIALSAVPLPNGWLDSLSPQALAFRAESESLMGADATSGSCPWSLTPFLTLRSLWMWLAFLALFYASIHLAESPQRVERLTWLMLLAGAAFGMYGIGQWLLGLRELLGTDPSAAGLHATGSFGNRNHYAAFMEMLLLCSIGWLGYRWASLSPQAEVRSEHQPWGRASVEMQEAKMRLFLAGLAVVALSLGLTFSLSRSGISFALAGCAVFALLASPVLERAASETIDLERSGQGRAGLRQSFRGQDGVRRHRRIGHVYWALALAVLGLTFWIGLDAVVTRFELTPRDWQAEEGRRQVWIDSLDTVKDFWLTGSGLSSFRYVYPTYRSFGGRIFYSWAHNDYLQATVELGVPGLVLILCIMAGVWRGARRVRRDLCDDPALLRLHAGFSAAAVAITLHSLTDFSLHMAANAALLSVIVGILVGLDGRRARMRQEHIP